MKVYDVLDTINAVESINKDLERDYAEVNKAISKVNNILTGDASSLKEAMGELQTAISFLVRDSKKSSVRCSEYAFLLKDILKSTELSWPPRCEEGE